MSKVFDKYRFTINYLNSQFLNELIQKTNSIDGFLCNLQIPLMWLICNDVKGKMVEVGCWKGRTTFVIGNSFFDFELYCVDHFFGSEEHQEQLKGSSTKEDFLKTIKHTRDISKINILEMTSVEASKNFEDNSLDCVFIDGSHDYKNVILDIESWLPKLKNNGIMIGHDYPDPNDPNGGFEELKKAVNEKVRDDKRFIGFDYICGLWGALKK